MNEKEPLVSVGVPTYNRSETLTRAIESALSQDYPNIEVVISDNASGDDTEAFCREVALKDKRIRYIRQPVNRGPSYNFTAVLKEAQGEYYMWLADDDWIETSYVSQCVKALETSPEFVVVTGSTVFHDADGTGEVQGQITNFVDESARKRVLHYYRTIVLNESFYGVMRRKHALTVEKAIGLKIVANDWLVVAALVFQGKVKTIDSTVIHRRGGGASASKDGIAASVGTHSFQIKHFWLSVAWFACHDIVTGNRVYASLPVNARWVLGLRVFGIVLKRHYYRYEVFPFGVRVVQKTVPRGLYNWLKKRHRS